MLKQMKPEREELDNQLQHSAIEQCSDVQLWQQLKNGNKEAFSQIFRKYYKPLNVYGLHMYPDPDFVRDCIQELFLELWLYRQTVGNVDSVKFYLFRSFRRKLFRRLESVRKNSPYELKETYEHSISDSFEALLIEEQTEDGRKHHIIKELSSLPKRQQEALYLKFYQDLSYEKIADIMSLNYQSVKNLVHNGIKSMREKLLHKDIFAIVVFLSSMLYICRQWI